MPFFDQLAPSASSNVASFASDLTQGLAVDYDTSNNEGAYADVFNQLGSKIQGLSNNFDYIVGGEGGLDEWGNELGHNFNAVSNVVKDYKGQVFSGIDNVLHETGVDMNSLPISKVGLVVILAILWPVMFTLFLWNIGGGSILPVAKMGTIAGRAVSEGLPMLTTLANKAWDHRADVIDLFSARSMDSLPLDSISSIINDIGNAMKKYE